MEVLPEQPVTQQPGRQVCHKHQRRVEKHLSPGATADTDEHKRACYECRKNFRPRQQTIFHVICCPPLQSAPTSPEGEDWLLVDAIQHLVWSRRDCANALNIPNMDTICTLYKHPIRFFGAFVSELCSFKKKKAFLAFPQLQLGKAFSPAGSSSCSVLMLVSSLWWASSAEMQCLHLCCTPAAPEYPSISTVTLAPSAFLSDTEPPTTLIKNMFTPHPLKREGCFHQDEWRLTHWHRFSETNMDVRVLD